MPTTPDEQKMTKGAGRHLPKSFSRKLVIALGALGTIAALQGGFAIWAVSLAEHHVQRGRVAADIKQGFTELWLDKQRFRNWLAQRQFGAGATDSQRDQYIKHMYATLGQLDVLAGKAVQLDDSAMARARQAQRADALLVLRGSVAQLERGLMKLNKPPVGSDTTTAWRIANQLFDNANGRDMRLLLVESLERESIAIQEKRLDTDTTLTWLRRLWLGTTLTLVAAALLTAVGFARALRRPLIRLSEGAMALRHGQLEHRIEVGGADEFAGVATSMNAMAEELSAHRTREAQARQILEDQVAKRTAELSHALDMQVTAEARRRKLFADISHELRTPATAIRGEAQVTLRGKQKPIAEYTRSLKRIEDAARQLGVTINDLLTMARSDIDTLSLRKVSVNLAEVLNDVVLHGEAISRTRGVRLTHETWPKTLKMTGDADRLTQLVLALVDNAVRYSHPGGEVRLAANYTANEPRQIEIRIDDDGIGIDDDALPKVFDRGYRSADAQKHSSEGSGLGLAIARVLARGHGGDIQLISRRGHGTTVIVTLPADLSLAEVRE